jgi:ribosomal protein S30
MKLAPSMPSCLVIDSSILIFFDRKGQLEDFLRQKKEENYKVVIPKAPQKEAEKWLPMSKERKQLKIQVEKLAEEDAV